MAQAHLPVFLTLDPEVPIAKEIKQYLKVSPTDPRRFGVIFSFNTARRRSLTPGIFALWPSPDVDAEPMNLARYFDKIGHVLEAGAIQLDPIEVEYFMLLRGAESYRRVVAEIGPHLSRRLLTAGHDVSVLREFAKRPTTIGKAQRSAMFERTVIKDPALLQAFRIGGATTRGIVKYGSSSPPTKIDPSLTEFGFRRGENLRIDFDLERSEVTKSASRTAAIIGENGIGKTAILCGIVEQAWLGQDVLCGVGLPPDIYFNKIVSFASSIDSFDRMTPPKKAAPVLYQRFYYGTSANSRRYVGLDELAYALARNGTAEDGTDRWKMFLSAMEVVGLGRDLAFRTHENVAVPLRLLQMPSVTRSFRWDPGERRMITGDGKHAISGWLQYFAEETRKWGGSLSSGDASFVRFALQFCTFVDQHSLVLIDEPETHLHPNLIGNFMKLLSGLLEYTKSYAIVATHSPYVIRQTDHRLVRVLRRGQDAGESVVLAPRLQTLGAGIGAISEFVFGPRESRSVVSDVIDRLSSAAPDSRVGSEVAPELVLLARSVRTT